MRNSILGVLAFIILMFGGATAAQAGAEMPMFWQTNFGDRGDGHNVVARLTQEALTKDALLTKQDPRHVRGETYIEGSPCLTLNLLLQEVRRDHPDLKIDSIDDLPGVFQSLIPHKAKDVGMAGKKVLLSRMYCVKPGASHAGDRVEGTGRVREIGNDEIVYTHPNLPGFFAAGDCTNGFMNPPKPFVPTPPPPVSVPLVQAPPNPCAYIDVLDTQPGDWIAEGAFVPQGSAVHDANCPIGIKFEGQRDFVPFADNCPDRLCSMREHQVLLNLAIARFGTTRSPGGKVTIRVPAYFAQKGELSRIALCLKTAVGKRACGLSVEPTDYIRKFGSYDLNDPGTYRATVDYVVDRQRDPYQQDMHWVWLTPGVHCWFLDY